MLFVVIVPGASASLPRVGVAHDFVWSEDKDIPILIQALKDADIPAVRMPIRGMLCEPVRGKWDFRRKDKAIRQLRDANIEILAIAASAPAWATGVDPEELEGFFDAFSPKDVQDYAEFLRKVVGRCKNHIHAWKIWQEQSEDDWYAPYPDVAEYVKLVLCSGLENRSKRQCGSWLASDERHHCQPLV